MTKVTIDGIKFDSIKEGERYNVLKVLEKAGVISKLEIHPKYPFYVESAFIFNYFADFRYKDENNVEVIGDVKEPITRKNPTYSIKKKCIQKSYNIKITEV